MLIFIASELLMLLRHDQSRIKEFAFFITKTLKGSEDCTFIALCSTFTDALKWGGVQPNK